MARKGKKNKKAQKQRKKQNYTKTEFREVFCQTCLMCKKPKPEFCYGYMYKNEPKSFVNKVFNNLIDIHSIYQSMARYPVSMSVEQFQNVVCRTGICFNGDPYASASCDIVEDCYGAFMKQICPERVDGAVIHEMNANELIEFKNNKSSKSIISYKKKKKKRKARYVCQSYPTFFCRDDEEFKATVRRILYGDHDIEQDQNQKLSSDAAGEASGHTAGGEPEV